MPMWSAAVVEVKPVTVQLAEKATFFLFSFFVVALNTSFHKQKITIKILRITKCCIQSVQFQCTRNVQIKIFNTFILNSVWYNTKYSTVHSRVVELQLNEVRGYLKNHRSTILSFTVEI